MPPLPRQPNDGNGSRTSQVTNGLQPLPLQSQSQDAVSSQRASRAEMGHGGIDLLGPIFRRKYIVLVFALIGAGLGYLHFVRTPPEFSSSLHVQIESSAVPSSIVNKGLIANGEKNSSIHKTLLAEPVVLQMAVENGKLDKLPMLANSAVPAMEIGKRLHISKYQGSDDVLELTLRGPNPQDLPVVLNNIVSAYEKYVKEDTQEIGKEAGELVDQLNKQLAGEQKTVKDRYNKLLVELVDVPKDERDHFVNPWREKMIALSLEKTDLESRSRDISERISALLETLQSKDRLALRVVAIEAAKYLDFVANESGPGVAKLDFKIGVANRRIENCELQIFVLETARVKAKSEYGDRHPDVLQIDAQIVSWKKRMEETKEAIKGFGNSLGLAGTTGNPVGSDGEKSADGTSGEADIRALYKTFLTRENKRLNSQLSYVSEQIKILEKASRAIGTKIVEANRLKGEIDAIRETMGAAMTRLAEINVLSDNHDTVKIVITDAAKLGTQVKPRMTQSIAYGVIFASLLGVGLALLVDRADCSFRSPAEVADCLATTVIGKIPRLRFAPTKKTRHTASLVALHQSSSGGAEAFRSLRTALFFASKNEGVKTILFTSPSPGDGKSTTISNLAVSIAQTGKRVCVVDADFRRPRIHEQFDEPIYPGVLQYLAGEVDFETTIRPSLQENLFLATAGGSPGKPGELITTAQFQGFLDNLREQFDFVLVDSPPVLPVADPAILSSLVDGVYVVMRIRKGVKLTAQKTRESLERVNANIMGVIINGVDENPHYQEYGYGYIYGYPFFDSKHEVNSAKYRENAKRLTQEKTSV